MVGGMGRWEPWGLVLCALSVGCGTADNRVDPADLELRDLLGISPAPASRWSAEQRAAARRVIAESASEEARVPLDPLRVSAQLAPFRDELARDVVVVQALARWDDRLAGEGVEARSLLRVTVEPGLARAAVRPVGRTAERLRSGEASAASPATGASAAAANGEAELGLQLAPAWSDEPLLALTDRGAATLVALARDAGHAEGQVIAVPAPRLVVLGAYLEASGAYPARLLVNPVLLAALEPAANAGDALGGLPPSHHGEAGRQGGAGDGATLGEGGDGEPAGTGGAGGHSGRPDLDASAIGGNPYSFYGSVAECAYAQRLRCQACVPRGDCQPITSTSDGNAECEALAVDGGRGYFLQCINLSLAITAIDACADETAVKADGTGACPREAGAARSLSTLSSNMVFLEDTGCRAALDVCLAELYGKPDGRFPEPGDDSGDPPRDIDVGCGDSCDDSSNNGNCSADPSCECTGPSCENSFSCDSTCSSSNDQSGCGDSGGSDDSGCGGDCSGDEGQGGDSGSCGGDEGGSSSGDSCGGGSGDSGCGGGGDCGGSGDSSCGGGGGCSSDSGSSSKCSVAPAAGPPQQARTGGRPPAILSFLLMGLWGLAPIPAAVLARRRTMKRAKRAMQAGGAEAPPPTAADADEEVAR